MKKVNLFILNYFLLSISLCSAGINTVEIQVKSKNLKSKTISVYWQDMVGGVRNILSEATVDHNGACFLKLEIEHPYFVFLNLDYHNQAVYIKPNGKYEVSIDLEKPYLDANFGGTDVHLNNYFEQYKRLYQQFKYRNKNYFEWGIQDFRIANFKLDSTLSSYRESFLNSNQLSEEERTLIVDIAKAEMVSDKMVFILTKYNPYYNKSPEIPEYLQTVEQQLPFNKLLLQSHNITYQMALKYYYQVGSAKKLQEIHKTDLTIDIFLKPTFEDIEKYSIESEFKELMLANLLRMNLIKRIPENFEIYKQKFEQVFPGSYFIKVINESYNRLLLIKYNNSEIEIIGKKPNNDTLKLSSFKSKFILVDFWATWCGPCIQEFPYLDSLQKKYIKANIIFMYVSIDKDREKWKNYLIKNGKLSNIHINLDDGKILETFAISSVPRYFLIGKNGELLETNLPSPSSGKLESILNEFLQKK